MCRVHRPGTFGYVAENYDVIIVGSGAGGGTLAHTLASSGKRILLLERGNFLPRELGNWDPGTVFVDGRYISPDTWFDADGKAFQPQVHYYVGGATKLYGAALYRLRPEDFGEIKHADGLSPAWPLSYDEFEPWYTKAEWLYQVHGTHGEDPTEGHCSKDYPWPAVSHEPRVQQISDALAAGGYHPFHAPVGILLNEANRPLSACIRCATCDGYPCLVHAKSDADIIAVRPLLDQPNVTLLVNAEVERLETDPSGRTVTRVQVNRDGKPGVLRGRHRGGLGRGGQQRQDPAPVGLRPAPGRPGQRVGPGRPQLHVPQQQGHRGARQGAQRHGVPEDARPERLLPRGERPGMAAGQHPDAREVQRDGHEGRGAQAHQAGPEVGPGGGRPARRGLLADHRGRAQAGQPGDGGPRRSRAPRLPARPTTPRRTGYTTSSGRCSTTSGSPPITC